MSNRILEIRKASKLRLRDVAVALGTTERTVNRWERGEVQIPDSQKMALAEYFHCSVLWLMGWEDGPNGNDDGHAADNNEAEEAA
jgi:transcriptional regulator with XRE-family HTH domain